LFKVCIDPGHGGSDPGACGNDLRECDIVLIVSQMVRSYLEAVGYEVILTRDADVDVYGVDATAAQELQARCNISDNAGADMFVSIHCNAAAAPEALGTETYYYALSAKGQKLSAYINNQLVGLGLANRGIKSSPLYVTRHTNAVAALTELAFISNVADAAKLGNTHWQDQFARAVALGITDYFANQEKAQ